MLKTSVKIFLMFVLVILVAVATGLATYNITKKMITETPTDATESPKVQADKDVAVGGETAPLHVSDSTLPIPEHFTVRLEGTTLNVYVSYDGKDEFLYNENIYTTDLSDQDIQLLRNGVEFISISELTGFIENFTS